MISIKKAGLLLAVFAVLGMGLMAQPPEKRSAMLIDAWGNEMNMAYMRQLAAAEVEVDAISHDQLTWVKQVNVLFLCDFPNEVTVMLNPERFRITN